MSLLRKTPSTNAIDDGINFVGKGTSALLGAKLLHAAVSPLQQLLLRQLL